MPGKEVLKPEIAEGQLKYIKGKEKLIRQRKTWKERIKWDRIKLVTVEMHRTK